MIGTRRRLPTACSSSAPAVSANEGGHRIRVRPTPRPPGTRPPFGGWDRRRVGDARRGGHRRRIPGRRFRSRGGAGSPRRRHRPLRRRTGDVGRRARRFTAERPLARASLHRVRRRCESAQPSRVRREGGGDPGGPARTWHLRPGSTIIVGGFTPKQVVGVAVEPDTVAFPLVGRPQIFVPYDVARSLAGAPADATNELLLWVHQPARLDITLAQARSASYGLRNLQFLTRSGIRIEIGQAAGIVVALLIAFSLVALAAAAAILAASAASEVQRRLHAIGVLRAVGASPGSIVAGHAVEAALVATPSAAIGVTAGWLVVRGPTDDLLAAINEFGVGPVLAALLAGTVAVIVAVVAVAAAVPAARAARRRPVDALRGADVSGAPRRAPLPAGPGGLGVRLILARPARSVTAVTVLAVSAAFALLILSIATLLSRLESEPQAIGRAYQLSVDAPPARLGQIRRLPGVAAATTRYDTFASDSFDLGESFEVVAFGADHTAYEAPPLTEGRHLRARNEAEVGLGLAQSLDLHPGSLVAAQLENGREARFRVVGIVRALSQQGRIAYVDARHLLAAEPGLHPTLFRSRRCIRSPRAPARRSRRIV